MNIISICFLFHSFVPQSGKGCPSRGTSKLTNTRVCGVLGNLIGPQCVESGLRGWGRDKAGEVRAGTLKGLT